MTLQAFLDKLRTMGPMGRVDFAADPRVEANVLPRAFFVAALLELRLRGLALATDKANAGTGLRWWIVPIARTTEEEIEQHLLVAEAELESAIEHLSMN